MSELKCLACGKDSDKLVWESVCLSCYNRISKNRDPQTYLNRMFIGLRSIRKNKFEWTIKKTDMMPLWLNQDGRCALSGLPMMLYTGSGDRHLHSFNASIDRIDPKIGYHLFNVQLVCDRANLIKNTLSEGELHVWVKSIHDYRFGHLNRDSNP